MGYVKCCKVWIIHLLLETNLTNHISMYNLLFQKKLVTRNETWILYENVNRKRTCSKVNKPSTVATVAPQKNSFIYLMGLERYNFPSFLRWNNKFCEVLSSNEKTRCCLSSWQRETTYYISSKRKAFKSSSKTKALLQDYFLFKYSNFGKKT